MGRVKEIREKKLEWEREEGRREGRRGKLESFMQAGHGLTLVQRIR